MIITEDPEKMGRSPSPDSRPSSRSSRSSYPSRRSTYDSRPSPSSSQSRRSSYAGNPSGRRGQSDNTHDFDEPPPEYTPLDPYQSHNQSPPSNEYSYRYSSRPQPAQPHNFIFNNNNRRRPRDRHTSPTQPPSSLQPTNNVIITRSNDNICGQYIIDPSKPGGSGWDTKNMALKTLNGSIDVDFAVLPTAEGNTTSDGVYLSFQSACGAVQLRWHDPPAELLPRIDTGVMRPVIARIKGNNGSVDLRIPRSFQGILVAKSENGKVQFSDQLTASSTILRDGVRFGRSTDIRRLVGEPPNLEQLVNDMKTEEACAASASGAANNDRHFQWNNYGSGNYVHISPRGRVSVNNSGSNVTQITMSNGSRSTYFSNGNGAAGVFPGLFNNAGNFNIIGGEFNCVGGNSTVMVDGEIISHTGNSRSSRSSTAASKFESEWKGSRVEATSMNGNVTIAYDDEYAFGGYGGWKSNNEHSPRRNQTADFVSAGGSVMSLLGGFMMG